MNDARHTGGPGPGLAGRFLERRPPRGSDLQRERPGSQILVCQLCVMAVSQVLLLVSSWKPWSGIHKVVLSLRAACFGGNPSNSAGPVACSLCAKNKLSSKATYRTPSVIPPCLAPNTFPITQPHAWHASTMHRDC